jgi:PAS domain S-box-containing protein
MNLSIRSPDTTGRLRGSTDQPQAKDALRESEERFSSAFEYAPIGMALVSLEGRWLKVNPALCKVVGYSEDELLTRTFQNITHPEDLEADLSYVRRIIAGEIHSYQLEKRYIHSSGRPITVQLSVSLVRDSQRQPRYFISQMQDITEHKRAEDELRWKTAFLEAQVDSALDGILVVDGQGRKILQNQRHRALWKEPAHIAEKEDYPAQLQFFAAQTKNPAEFLEKVAYLYAHPEEVSQDEIELVDGTILDRYSSPVRDKAGRHYGRIWTFRDITERKRAEERIAEQAALIDQTHDVIVVRDLNHRIIFWNKGAERLYGLTAAEAIGREIDELIQFDAVTFLEAFKTVLRDGKWSGEMQKITGAGDKLMLHTRWTLLRDARNQPKSILVIGTDITERKRAEGELRKREDRFRLLIENASDLITILNGEGLIRFQSPSAKRLLGYEPEDVVGRNAFEFIHPLDAARAADTLKRALTDANVPWSEEYRFRHQDGSWRTLQSIGRNIPGEAADGFVVINSRDVTESRDLEAQFRQAQKMEAFGQLASGVAHDFNNILAVIKMLAGLLRREQALASTPMDFATEIETAAERGANLTRQLLLFSQRQALQPRDLDLNETIKHIAKMLHRILGEDVHMQFKFAPQPLFVHADAGMLDQILLNLTVNARDAMPKGGRLIIETQTFEFDGVTAAQTAQARPGSFVCLSVTDTGCGIPTENLPRIFEPFFTTKEVGKGSGLGLATVFGIVQQHNGWINVYSEVGLGTAFRVYLPRLTQVPNHAAGGPALATITGGSETILLVEDDSALRTTMQIVLSGLGYRVLEARNGVEALEVWKQHRHEIHLLLTDLVMDGGITGRELAGQLLQQDSKLRVLYVSGYSAEIASKDFLLEEGVNFLPKPFEAHRLAQALRNCLGKNQPTKST